MQEQLPDAGQFFASTGCAVEKLRSPTADLMDGMSIGRESGVAFLFGYFLFTPGIGQPLHALPQLRHPCRRLPYALRASCAVRMRILRMRGHTKRK